MNMNAQFMNYTEGSCCATVSPFFGSVVRMIANLSPCGLLAKLSLSGWMNTKCELAQPLDSLLVADIIVGRLIDYLKVL